ncbi:MAG: hypothetical protein ACTSRW_09140 [Candidatus Helarchaeota archaeon]
MVVFVFQLFRELAIGFTFGLIFINFAFAVTFYMLYVTKGKENRLFQGVSLFFFFVGISRIFYMIFDFYQTEFNPALFQFYSPTWKIATAFIIIGFGFFFFIADHNFFNGKDKYAFTIAYIVFGITTLSIPDFFLSELLSSSCIFITVLFIPGSYLYMAWHTSNDLRRKSLTVFFSFLIYGAGLVILGEVVINFISLFSILDDTILRYCIHVISAIIKIAGASLMLYGFS